MGILILLIALTPFFFFKLGQTSLYSFDEAWYAEIAKQISLSKSFMVMHFNNQVFTDHPPAGFWLIALGQQLFGVNEFGSRIMSASFGLFGLL
jgi:4-amino-4-deoxy-L-arabinose transferase